MPRRALIERRPWMLASMAAAVALAWAMLGQPAPGIQSMVLAFAALGLLAVYALLRHRGSDTRLLGLMLGLEGIGMALGEVYPGAARLVLMLGWLAGLSLFLSHRVPTPDMGRRIGAGALLILTPLLCWFAGDRAGESVPLFYGLALGALAGAAWMSSFPQARVGIGGVMLVFSSVIGIARGPVVGPDPASALAVWVLFYLGNLVLATGVTGELRRRVDHAAMDWSGR